MVGTLAALIALAVTPTVGAPIATSPITINSSPGHQLDPHVDGDIAAYTNFAAGSEIRYYDFLTGLDSAVPTEGNRDQLSDLSLGRIVFTRSFSDGREAVMLFDTAGSGSAVEVNGEVGSARSAVAIGGNTIAYIDHLLSADGSGELVAFDLLTSVPARLTLDTVTDQAPAVSPDGKVVVWERCPGGNTANCDVVMAVSTTSGWTVSNVAATLAPEGFPDTNGTQVVYTAHNGTDYDVYWRAVAGGVAERLELPLDQVHPSIAGDVIAFEGRVSDGSTDLFIYHLATGELNQLTNTPGINEALNDVTVLADDSVRVVWQANDGSDGANDIHGATFALAGAPNTTDGGVGSPPDAGSGDTHCHGRHHGNGHRSHGNGHGYGHHKHHKCGGGHHGDQGHHGGDDDDDDHGGGSGHHGDDDDHGGGSGHHGDDDDHGGGSGHHGDDDDDHDGGSGRHGDDDDHGHKSGGRHGGGHHDRTGSVRQHLTPDEPSPAMGCSSTGSAAVPLALLMMSLALLLRPRTKRAEARGRQQ